ncbi:Fe-S cluster assembly protein HesB [Hoyosella sp. YIM 151337]|uniref:HhH-GPD-type base excision DNA repair protein n=1 Tax=Hoyosella sp. YIM 151337 TaxID=2992742 RepID=UPI0022360482|nr:HhH-GPD-type base excision DNA repair protein [Hoyosella sp. YIM 151337]MCW4352954.1 Fe-S cluster assembly protein HesB [Hoyosella sp. YIM 151337]
MVQLRLVGDPDADELLSNDPLAALLGMLLDQQIAMEVAFAGPKKIADRAGSLDAHALASMDPEQFAALCAQPPAVHRFPGAMAKRIQALCQFIEDNYDGKADAIWKAGNPDGREILKRLKALPGYGDQKARIFLALLGKQYGIDAQGWREAAGEYGEEGSHRSIADVTDEKTLLQVREFKRSMKAAKKVAAKDA